MEKQCSKSATKVFSTISFLTSSEIDDLTKYEALCEDCFKYAIEGRHTAMPKVSNEISAKILASAKNKCECKRDICHLEF